MLLQRREDRKRGEHEQGDQQDQFRVTLDHHGAIYCEAVPIGAQQDCICCTQFCGIRLVYTPATVPKHRRSPSGRREFLKRSLLAAAAVPVVVPEAEAQTPAPATNQPSAPRAASPAAPAAPRVAYPRTFAGAQLSEISFPLGGVGAGCIGLGGRGQLRDWEIFNRPAQGNSPSYAFPAIRVDDGTRAPFVSVLEARLQPPYQGAFGMGSQNAPGLQRLQGATFTGEFPLARMAFHDRRVPVRITLEAFSPFIPHETDDSGLPVAVLRYSVKNVHTAPVTVSIAYSIENGLGTGVPVPRGRPDPRANDLRSDDRVRGLLMHNPWLATEHPLAGSLGLWILNGKAEDVSILRGWPRARWWTSALHFWDDFSTDGALGPETEEPGPVGAVCLRQSIPVGGAADYTFLITWNFPNRTPAGCGWVAPSGEADVVIGNYYCTKFKDAFETAAYVGEHLPRLEAGTRAFADALRDSTLPDAVKDAASANLSTLVTQTCFRTADGEFHAFEGCGETRGCCEGNCTHVWNYETATAHLFPDHSRSFRRSAFGFSMDDAGGMRFRQWLPDGKERSYTVAADGQMGQIMKVYLDWRLSGDDGFLREFWPKAKKALAYAWLENGWDANRDGVLEGPQHNTYDIEFYGPNPLCGIYYLGALRAAEEMARAAGDDETRVEVRRLFDQGRAWIDANLFNGEYYVQKIEGRPANTIRAEQLSTMGSDDTVAPEYQMGNGCLVDQLVGQYQAEVSGLGPLIDPQHCRTTLESIYRYNYKRSLYEHDTVQRTFALNDEAALVVADYGRGERPKVPFPYYAEGWTGLEYTAASHMIYAGMVQQGIECITNVRARYDGARRNPWDEPECGSHYARALSSWSGVLALSGFRYHGGERHVEALPRLPAANFRCFWSTGTGWGTFSYGAAGSPLTIRVLHGTLACRSVSAASRRTAAAAVRVNGQNAQIERAARGPATRVTLNQEIVLKPGLDLVIEL
jgi:non-lysosomal glucosylceramidase